MSNLSDILLAIRALGPEDIRAFAETAKLAITEEERRRLDAIPPIPEVDEAREIPVTSTYPLIYISNEDLTNATHKITPNAMFPDKPTKTLVQNIDTPVIVGSGKSNGGYLNTNFSIVCYKSLPANYMLLIGNVYDGRPVDTSDMKINSTRLGEKVVFVFFTQIGYQLPGMGDHQYEKGRFIVITNFGNIFSGVRNTQSYRCSGHPAYPVYKEGRINNRAIDVVPSDIKSEDEFCRVPQIFVDLMCFVIRSFSPEYTSQPQAEPGFTVNEDYFKTLCRQYNKDRKDLRDQIRERDDRIKSLEDASVTELEKLGQDLSAEFGKYDELIKKTQELQDAYAVLQDRQERLTCKNNSLKSMLDIMSMIATLFFICMCITLF